MTDEILKQSTIQVI